MADPDLTFLAKQIERLLQNDARQQDDLAVLTAMVTRLESSMNTMPAELHALHRQIGGIYDRMDRMEETR